MTNLNTQQIMDELEKAKNNLRNAKDKLEQNRYIPNESEKREGLDVEEAEKMVRELDNKLNDAILKLTTKEDEGNIA